MTNSLSIAARAARVGGQIVAERFTAQRDRFWKVQDGVSSIVTDADFASDAAIRSYLASIRPSDLILSEEGQPVDMQAPHVWVVDPLDGTTNYSHGIPFGSVSVGYAERGEVVAGAVFDPFHREMFTAEKGHGARRNGQPIKVTAVANPREAIVACGPPRPERPGHASALRMLGLVAEQFFRIRVYGSTATELCWVAAGRLEGTVNWGTHWWDVAAAALILMEAGGTFSPRGESWYTNPTSTTIGSNGLVHATIEALLKQCSVLTGAGE